MGEKGLQGATIGAETDNKSAFDYQPNSFSLFTMPRRASISESIKPKSVADLSFQPVVGKVLADPFFSIISNLNLHMSRGNPRGEF
jgi:hypothetical protein